MTPDEILAANVRARGDRAIEGLRGREQEMLDTARTDSRLWTPEQKTLAAGVLLCMAGILWERRI